MPQDWKELLKGTFAEELANLEPEPEPEVPAPVFRKQRLVVTIDRRRRAGKQVTLVSGFSGDEAELEALGKQLKTKLGVGGSVKDGEILIQGDVRDKVVAFLNEMGHSAKRGN
jgi:translation initiation factor 1